MVYQDPHLLRKTAFEMCTHFVSYFTFGDTIADILQQLPSLWKNKLAVLSNHLEKK